MGMEETNILKVHRLSYGKKCFGGRAERETGKVRSSIASIRR